MVRARRALELADLRAQSRQESELRVVLHLADLYPDLHVQVWDAAGPVCWLDLAFREWRVGVAYDGQWHALRLQLRKDFYRHPDQVIRTVRAALSKARQAR